MVGLGCGMSERYSYLPINILRLMGGYVKTEVFHSHTL